MIADQVPIGTFCRLNNIVVFWDDPASGQVDMLVSQEEEENLYFAIVLQHDDVNNYFGTRRIVRCLALGFETGPDNTFWTLGSQRLEPF